MFYSTLLRVSNRYLSGFLIPQTVLALWGSQLVLRAGGGWGWTCGFDIHTYIPQTVLALWGSQLLLRPVKGNSGIPVPADLPRLA